MSVLIVRGASMSRTFVNLSKSSQVSSMLALALSALFWSDTKPIAIQSCTIASSYRPVEIWVRDG